MKTPVEKGIEYLKKKWRLYKLTNIKLYLKILNDSEEALKITEKATKKQYEKEIKELKTKGEADTFIKGIMNENKELRQEVSLCRKRKDIKERDEIIHKLRGEIKKLKTKLENSIPIEKADKIDKEYHNILKAKYKTKC